MLLLNWGKHDCNIRSEISLRAHKAHEISSADDRLRKARGGLMIDIMMVFRSFSLPLNCVACQSDDFWISLMRICSFRGPSPSERSILVPASGPWVIFDWHIGETRDGSHIMSHRLCQWDIDGSTNNSPGEMSVLNVKYEWEIVRVDAVSLSGISCGWWKNKIEGALSGDRVGKS